MKKSQWVLFILTLTIIGGTAGLLLRMKTHQKLGAPGVKVGSLPLYDPDGKEIAKKSVLMPANLSGYVSTNLPITAVESGTLPKDTIFGKRLYQSSDGFQSQMTTILMGADRTSIHKPQFCLVGQGWTIDKTETTEIKMERPFPYNLPVMKLTTSLRGKDKSGRPIQLRGLYVYWFVADKQLTASHFERVWWGARNLVRTGVIDRWAYISCFSPCLPGQEDDAFERMKKLIIRAAPEFQLATGKPLSSSSAKIQTAFK